MIAAIILTFITAYIIGALASAPAHTRPAIPWRTK